MPLEEAKAFRAPVTDYHSVWARLIRGLLSFRVMLALGLAVITVLTVSNRFNDPDLWWHLKLGQIVWNTHSIPSTDMLSYTAYGHAYTAHEWLAQLSIYGAYRLCGYTGLMLWLAVLASVLFILVYVLCYLSTQNALVAFLGGVCAWFFGTVGLAIRPLILGHIFLAAELYCSGAGDNSEQAMAMALATSFRDLGKQPRLVFLRDGRSVRLLDLLFREREVGAGGCRTVGQKKAQAARRDCDSLRCRSLLQSGRDPALAVPAKCRVSTIDNPERD